MITHGELLDSVHLQPLKSRKGYKRIAFQSLVNCSTSTRQVNGDHRVGVQASTGVADDSSLDFSTHGYDVAFAVVSAIDLRNSSSVLTPSANASRPSYSIRSDCMKKQNRKRLGRESFIRELFGNR